MRVVFNNNGDSTETYSSVTLIAPTIVDSIYIKEDGKYLPSEFDWIWSGDHGHCRATLPEVNDPLNKP